MKNYFFGKYYKFVTKGDFSFALIDSESNEGPAMQLITKDGGFQIQNLDSVIISDEEMIFNISQEDISLVGKITMGKFHPLKGKAMGPFSLFSMECSHDVYSMYHSLSGEVIYNGQTFSFENGYGYIEGDSGVNFPEKYIWYNSVGDDYGVTMAIATIPFGLIHFTGILGFISYQGKEYDLCTYTGAKIIEATPERIEIKRASYHLIITLKEHGGYLLKAPEMGNMNRYIKENVAVVTEFELRKGNQTILTRKDEKSSLEFMYDFEKK